MSKLLFIFEYNEYLESILNNIESDLSDEYIYAFTKKVERKGILPFHEGLIYSQPQEKVIRILKNRFKELEIKTYQDGDISIESLNDRLGKYLPLINNLGYFVASAFKNDNQIDITTNDIHDIICDEIYIEPKYDFQVDPPKILYHASPMVFKNKILKSGLVPKSGNKLSSHPDRIYLSDSFLSAMKFGKYLLKSPNKYYENGFCIFKIKGDSIDKLYSDINFRIGGYYTLGNIDKNSIELVYEYKPK